MQGAMVQFRNSWPNYPCDYTVHFTVLQVHSKNYHPCNKSNYKYLGQGHLKVKVKMYHKWKDFVQLNTNKLNNAPVRSSLQ